MLVLSSEWITDFKIAITKHRNKIDCNWIATRITTELQSNRNQFLFRNFYLVYWSLRTFKSIWIFQKLTSTVCNQHHNVTNITESGWIWRILRLRSRFEYRLGQNLNYGLWHGNNFGQLISVLLDNFNCFRFVFS